MVGRAAPAAMSVLRAVPCRSARTDVWAAMSFLRIVIGARKCMSGIQRTEAYPPTCRSVLLVVDDNVTSVKNLRPEDVLEWAVGTLEEWLPSYFYGFRVRQMEDGFYKVSRHDDPDVRYFGVSVIVEELK